MPNPGSFQGACFDFLQSQRRLYDAAVIAKSKTECVSDIQRRYFKWFPIEHEHNVDPTPEFLEGIDDDEADTEIVAPDPSSMSPDDYTKADEAFKERQKLVTFRKEVSSLGLVIRFSSRAFEHYLSNLSELHGCLHLLLPSSKSNDGSNTTIGRPKTRRSKKRILTIQSTSSWLVLPVLSSRSLVHHLPTIYGRNNQISRSSSTRSTDSFVLRDESTAMPFVRFGQGFTTKWCPMRRS